MNIKHTCNDLWPKNWKIVGLFPFFLIPVYVELSHLSFLTFNFRWISFLKTREKSIINELLKAVLKTECFVFSWPLLLWLLKRHFNTVSVMDSDIAEYDTWSIFFIFLLETLMELCIKLISSKSSAVCDLST